MSEWNNTEKPSSSSGEWEKSLIEKLAMSAIIEQRRSRRWGIFFKFLFFGYFLLILFLFSFENSGTATIGKHTAMVELKGIISDDSAANADNMVTALRAAYKDKNTKGIIIKANSPGGSPVQAAYIYNEIKRLRNKHPNIPVYAVVTDVCASACYFIISAADKIYANESSIVGSIGVIAEGFGFVGLINKLGIERRIYTAGENKGMLDPFSPVRERDTRHMQAMLDEVHEYFITAVKKGRGNRIKDDKNLFSGLFWSGITARKLGLIDGFASTGMVARDIIKEEKIVDYTPEENLLKRITDRLGSSIADQLLLKSNTSIR